MKIIHRQQIERRGFSLMELVVSLGIMGVFIAGLSSAIMIAVQVWKADPQHSQRLESAEVLNELLSEIHQAHSFSEMTPNAITFTVPDRDGDLSPETIRCSWSGVAGAPLFYQYNDFAAEPLIGSMQNFQMDFGLRAMQGTGGDAPAVLTESTEGILMQHVDAPSGSFKEYSLASSAWCAQYFKPTLPANAVSWKITRVSVVVKQNSATTETLQVQLWESTTGELPFNNPLGAMSIAEAALPLAYNWVDIVFASPIADLDPFRGVCLVLKQTGANSAAKVHYEENGTPMLSNSHWTTTNNSGTSWSAVQTTKDLRFKVYGTYTTTSG